MENEDRTMRRCDSGTRGLCCLQPVDKNRYDSFTSVDCKGESSMSGNMNFFIFFDRVEEPISISPK